ncbi:MAG: ParB/RepB/Spo0J family partition protein [Planctomycetota bacterium]
MRRVPVVVREPGTPDRGMLELALIENIQREDLDPIERAKACRRLMVQYGLTQEKVAERLGYERSTVANLVRLLELPAEIQASVSRETITAGHARALLRLNGLPSQKEAFARAVREGWSVRATEAFVAQATQGRVKPLHRARPRRPAWVGEMQERITRSVGVQAEVRLYRRGGGRLVLPFSDLDELDRLSKILGLPGEAEELLAP